MDAAPYVTACPVGCAAPLAATRIVLREGALLECAECGQLVSQASAGRYADTMRAFDDPDYNQPLAGARERRARVSRRRLARIAALRGTPPAQMRLLDVGCSRGQFVAAAAACGFRAEGVEPAPAIAAAARAAGLNVHTGYLEDAAFADETFDALTLFEVLEHLKDPLTLLRECRRVLKSGGVLCATTGNTRSWTVVAMGARWDYFDLERDGGHVSFYNPRSLALLAQRAGFSVARIETSRVRFTESAQVPRALHVAAKAAAELLSLPARLAHRGHDMIGYFTRA